ncbi:MAG TPA: Ig domain-containing protein [Vulgatibacter sp.]|nr:Ig domain-containing protein [Vulgatibacter sp.]
MSHVRHAALGLSCLLAVGAAASAGATTEYKATLVPIQYESLPIAGGEPLVTVSGADEYIVNQSYEITLPFPVRFFGVEHTIINMASVGYVTFGPGGDVSGANNYAGALAGHDLPDPMAPNDLIAVWWIESTCYDTSSPANLPLYSQVIGTAPNRQFILQWHCRRYTMFQSVSQFQLVFTEGSERIEARYGIFTTGSDTREIEATMGVENATGTAGLHGPGLTGVPCGTVCDRADFPLGHAVIYEPNQKFGVTALDSDPVAYLGRIFHVRAEIENGLPTDALGFDVEFWLSPTPGIDSSSTLLGRTEDPVDALSQTTISVELDAMVPGDLPPGTYHLVARADPDEVLALDDRAGTTRSHGPLVVSTPMADVAVSSIATPPWIQVGTPTELGWEARNLGVADAGAMTYEVVLSSTGTLGDDAVPLASGVLPPILEGAAVAMTDEIVIPEAFEPGRWWIGVVIDPGGEDDASPSNNVRVAPLQVRHPLALEGIELPAATVGFAYSAQLVATGGDGNHAFRLGEGGELPPGLGLSEDGLLSGTPTALFSGSFPVEVESAGLTASADFSLIVEAPPLELEANGPSSGQVGVPFALELRGKGGVPPYEFALSSGTLPDGLELVVDEITGTPAEDGIFRVTVTVTDSVGVSASGDLTLTIEKAPSLFCVNSTLDPMVLLASASAQVAASGGTRPYTWTTLTARRLPSDLEPQGAEMPEGAPPPGLTLDALSGVVKGSPEVVGTYEWMLHTEDATGLEVDCKVTFDVVPDRELVLPSDLPRATLGEAYSVTLVAEGGGSVVTWKPAGVAGLVLDSAGVLSGTPQVEIPDGESQVSVSLPLEAWDEHHRVGGETATLVVARKPAPGSGGAKKKGGGCQAAGGDASLALLGLGLAVLGRGILRRI